MISLTDTRKYNNKAIGRDDKQKETILSNRKRGIEKNGVAWLDGMTRLG